MDVTDYLMFKQVNSVRKGKLIEMNTTTSEFGRQSLFLRGPVTWNILDRDIRNAENINYLKSALKKKSRLMETISYIKGQCNNLNRRTEDFIYY